MADNHAPIEIVDETPKKKRITIVKPSKGTVLALLSAATLGAVGGATVVSKKGKHRKDAACIEVSADELKELASSETSEN